MDAGRRRRNFAQPPLLPRDELGDLDKEVRKT